MQVQNGTLPNNQIKLELIRGKYNIFLWSLPFRNNKINGECTMPPLAFNILEGHKSWMVKVMLPKFLLDLSFLVVSSASLCISFVSFGRGKLKLENGPRKDSIFSFSKGQNSRKVKVMPPKSKINLFCCKKHFV